jgi:porin
MHKRRSWRWFACVLWAASCWLGGGRLGAQTPAATAGSEEDRVASPTTTEPGNSLSERDRLTGDWDGWRTNLQNAGLTVNAVNTNEIFGNPTGGRRQGVIEEGLLDTGMDADLEKLVGWQGARLHFNTYDLYGPSGTDKYVGDAGRFSNIDYYDSFRLYELWLEQNLAGSLISLRLGQLAADQEFCGSPSGNLFINSNFGMPPTLSANMPVPIFAAAAPGVRLRVQPADAFFAQAAVFDGNPDPDSLGDPSPGFQPGTSYNRHGIKINLNSREGAFSLFELDWLPNHGDKATGLPGTYKIGGWYHTDTFSDQRYNAAGQPLAVAGGLPRALHGDFGGYLVCDQTLYQPSAGGDACVTGFFRLSAAPGDRNAVSFYIEGGFNAKGLVPGRSKDIFGLGVTCERYGDSLRAEERDQNRALHTNTPIQDEEVALEATYQAAWTPWLSFQPDAQVIVHPGGSSAYSTALVMGLRSVVSF